MGPCVTRLCWLSQDASFHLRERQYRQQYSALYFTRLMQLKPVMEQRVRQEWPQVEGTVTWDRRSPSFLLPLGSPDCSQFQPLGVVSRAVSNAGPPFARVLLCALFLCGLRPPSAPRC